MFRWPSCHSKTHLIELDGAHHRNGPRTKAGIETAEREDGYIHRIMEATRLAGVFEKTTFFVVSDDVSVVDVASLKVTGKIKVGDRPGTSRFWPDSRIARDFARNINLAAS